jgi:hypothetical protein
MVRNLELKYPVWTHREMLLVSLALLVSGILSIWLAAADTHLANLQREAAYTIKRQNGNENTTLWYEGHWGFQYYMEQLGAVPVDGRDFRIRPGDHVVIPENNAQFAGLPQNLTFRKENILELPNPSLATTISWRVGAGFYSSYWGPLPFTFGPVPPERYVLLSAGL